MPGNLYIGKGLAVCVLTPGPSDPMKKTKIGEPSAQGMVIPFWIL